MYQRLTRTDKLNSDKFTFKFGGDNYKTKLTNIVSTSLNSVDLTAVITKHNALHFAMGIF